MKSLKEREGELIEIFCEAIHHTATPVRLRKVENAGLWIESQELTNDILKGRGLTSLPDTVVLFLPWHEITWLLDFIPVPSFSDDAAKLD